MYTGAACIRKNMREQYFGDALPAVTLRRADFVKAEHVVAVQAAHAVGNGIRYDRAIQFRDIEKRAGRMQKTGNVIGVRVTGIFFALNATWLR